MNQFQSRKITIKLNYFVLNNKQVEWRLQMMVVTLAFYSDLGMFFFSRKLSIYDGKNYLKIRHALWASSNSLSQRISVQLNDLYVYFGI